jgi:predicted transcriptional regulator
MKSGERYYTWKEIAGELGREEGDVKRTWARGLKERRIRELSVEYERIKWGVIAQVMGIGVEECVDLASELELL